MSVESLRSYVNTADLNSDAYRTLLKFADEFAIPEARVLALTEERERDRDRHHTLTAKLDEALRKVEDAEWFMGLADMDKRVQMFSTKYDTCWQAIRAARKATE